ncbi:MAG TPA: flavin reductase family protein [Syntrophorhabdales bacterium]|nr:flavin reductase family protein [Syntrophorhabdales bacterium]
MKRMIATITHLMPCSVALLTVGTADKKDAMTVTCMFISEELPHLVVSVAKDSMSHQLIEETGDFVLNIVSREQVNLARELGASHGAKVDKFKKFKIPTEPGSADAASLIKGSLASLECKVITSFPAYRHTIYLAEVVNYKVDDAQIPVAWYKDTYFVLGAECKTM